MRGPATRLFLGVTILFLPGSIPPTAAGESDEWKKHEIHVGFHTNVAVAGDFTADGLVDVISNSGNATRLLVAPSWKEVILGQGPEHGCIHGETMDVDGDGDPDFIGARYSPGLIFWLERPDDPLAVPWPYHLIDDQINGTHGVLRGDVDGDGTLDLLAGSAQSFGPFPESLLWYRIPDSPRSAASWQRHVLADRDAPGLSHYIGVGDVNGDGRADAASAAKGGPSARPGTGDWFAWWEAPNNPTKTWQKHIISDHQPGATNIHPADVDGDGRTDFIASRGHGEGVIWFEAPDWREHPVAPTLKGPHCLAVADLDLDGDIDAATCAKDDRVAAWFENDGRGGFTTHTIGRQQAAYDLRAVDIDGDGDLDILVAGQASKNVVWYESPVADTIRRHLATVARVGPEGAGSASARTACAALAATGIGILPWLIEAMGTDNIVAANWYRTVYEPIVAREHLPGRRRFPAAFLHRFVRDPARSGRVRRLVLDLLDEIDPGERSTLLPTLLDDPEFREDAVALALKAGELAAESGADELARVNYRRAFDHARDRSQIATAASHLSTAGVEVSIGRHLGAVTRWRLVGPFHAPDTTGYARQFAPEDKLDFDATYEGKDGARISWTVHQTRDRFGQVNLIGAIGPVSEAVGYAHVEIGSPCDQRVEIRCGADDNIRVWLNGEPVVGQEQWLNGTRTDRFTAPVSLRKGTNSVLVKICQGPQHVNLAVGNNWTFHLRICDATGAGADFDNLVPATRRDR